MISLSSGDRKAISASSKAGTASQSSASADEDGMHSVDRPRVATADAQSRDSGSTAGRLTRGTIRYAGQAPRGGGSVRSTMMDLPLTITSIMRYGTSVFGDFLFVTWTGTEIYPLTFPDAL